MGRNPSTFRIEVPPRFRRGRGVRSNPKPSSLGKVSHRAASLTNRDGSPS